MGILVRIHMKQVTSRGDRLIDRFQTDTDREGSETGRQIDSLPR